MYKIEEELNKLDSYLSNPKNEHISLVSIKEQLKLFVEGVKIPKLIRPCTINDGIVKIASSDIDELINKSNLASLNGRLIKFVPASGAASRMFHKLHTVLSKHESFSLNDLSQKSKIDKDYQVVLDFLENLNKFSFYDDLKTLLNSSDVKIQKLVSDSPAEIIKAVLFEKGLNYSSKPKGAIKFHRYKTEHRTAFEEQIYESCNYIADKNEKVKIHFTISEEHTELFNSILADFINNETKNRCTFDITFSYQKKSTDTIAVDHSNKIVFDKSGNPIHRPGGHGALIENLNDLKADIVIIKNIDNLSTENLAKETFHYKKLLSGYLVKIQNKIFELLTALDSNDFSKINFNDILNFAEKNLFIIKPIEFDNWTPEKKRTYLFNKLNRPIRVCGMVKNVGEPGGGPFWVKDENGELSLQIIEQAQINKDDEKQKEIFKQSTHFNPVDLICGVKDFKGNNFDLNNFIDHKSGIITTKSKHGIELKALELPGLWNGSMADWITIFVEVPLSTFNPVKEINDLLRKEHQN